MADGVPIMEQCMSIRVAAGDKEVIELQAMDASVHITNVALPKGAKGPACLEVSTGVFPTPVAVATLDSKCRQGVVDLTFFQGDEEVKFYCTGSTPIHLIGAIITELDDGASFLFSPGGGQERRQGTLMLSALVSV